MSLQPQNSIYSDYATFPSEPENHFRAVKGEVVTEVEPNFHQVDTTFQIGFAGNLVSVRLGVAVPLADNGLQQFNEGVAELASAKADLDFLNTAWVEFYAAAKAALDEVPTVTG